MQMTDLRILLWDLHSLDHTEQPQLNLKGPRVNGNGHVFII
jgi:hypothetical protein